MEEVKRKRGRPKKDGSRYRQLKVLLTDDEMKKLQDISKKYGISQADIVREGTKDQIDYLETINRVVDVEDIHDSVGEYPIDDCNY